MSRTRRVVIALLTTIALVPGPAAVANDTDPLVEEANGVVDGSGNLLPDPPASLPADEARFVTLWTARFRGPGTLQAYLTSDIEFDDGFNDRSEDEKRRLVDVLVAYWLTIPGVADAMATAALDPDQMDADDLRGLVYQVIFAKEAFKASVRAPESAKTDPVEAAPPGVPDDAAPVIETADERARRLAEALEKAGAVYDQQVPTVPDAPNPSVWVEAPPTGPEALGVLDETTDLLLAALTPVTELLAQVSDAVGVRLTRTSAYRQSDVTDTGLTFTPCFQTTSMPTESCGLPVPVEVRNSVLGQVGVPALYDANGDLLPDVKLEVGVDPLASVGAASVGVTLTRLTANGSNVRGVARYRLPGTDAVIAVGFDGRSVGLQTTQQVEVKLHNVLTASTQTDMTATLTHSGSAPTVKLVAGFSSATAPTALALGTVATITRTPSPITARITAKDSGSLMTYAETFDHNVVSTNPAELPAVSVAAVATLGASRIDATVGFTGMPMRTSVTTTAEDSGRKTVSYTASSMLTGLDANVRYTPTVATPGDYATATARLANLPTSVTIVTDKLPVTTPAAETTTMSRTSAMGIGYTSDPDPRTAVTYTASSAIGAVSGNALDVGFGQVKGNVAQLVATAGLENVPVKWQAVLPTQAHRNLTFDSYGAPVGRISASVALANGLFANGLVTGFPGRADLTLPTASSPRLGWNASGPVTSIAADARFGAYEGHLTITGVPASWLLTLPSSGKASFTAPSPVGTFDAWFSTTGSRLTGGTAYPNHATFTRAVLANPKVVNGETIGADVTGSLRLNGVKVVSFEPTATGAKVDVQAGGGGNFLAVLSLDDAKQGTRTYARATLSPLPSRVYGTIGSVVDITSTASVDLDAELEKGTTAAIAVTPAAPRVHGASYRDGQSGNGTAIKVKVYLTGLPTHVVFDGATTTITGFRPTVSSLTVDYQRDNDPASILRLVAVLAGLPSSGDLTMTFTKAKTASGGSTTRGSLSGSASLGTLSATIDTGDLTGSIVTTALPSRISFAMTEESGTNYYTWDASGPVSQIDGTFGYRKSGATAITVRGRVRLTDLPPYFTLTTGTDPAGAGALFTYDTGQSGVPAQRLDAYVYADGTMTSPNAAVAANLEFVLTDLGSYARLAKSGSDIVLTATGGEIGVIEATVSALGAGEQRWNGNWGSGFLRLGWRAGYGVAGAADDLTVRLTRIQSFRFTPGLVSDVSGTFGTFHMSWRAFLLTAMAYAGIDVVIDWPSWLSSDSSIPIFSISIPYTSLGLMKFHVFTPDWQRIWSRTFDFWVRGYQAYVDIRPKHYGTYSGLRHLGGLTLGGSTPTYQQYLVTPNPFPLLLPGWAVQIATGVIKHKGGFIRGGVDRLW